MIIILDVSSAPNVKFFAACSNMRKHTEKKKKQESTRQQVVMLLLWQVNFAYFICISYLYLQIKWKYSRYKIYSGVQQFFSSLSVHRFYYCLTWVQILLLSDASLDSIDLTIISLLVKLLWKTIQMPMLWEPISAR